MGGEWRQSEEEPRALRVWGLETLALERAFAQPEEVEMVGGLACEGGEAWVLAGSEVLVWGRGPAAAAGGGGGGEGT